MIAILNDNQWIYFDNITDAEENILWEEFSVSRPGRYVDPTQMANWDGVFRKYNRGRRRMARPFLSMLRGVCNKHNLPLSVRDLRPAWNYQTVDPDTIDENFLPGIKLEQYQIDCIRKTVRVECGIIDIPTGGGKGELIAGTCKAIPCPTIILADQVIVVKQLKERLELRDVAEEVGMFYAGKRPNGQMVVIGSIQSLTLPTKPPEVPTQKMGEGDISFQKRMEQWDKKFKAFKTRRKNAKVLIEYVRKAEMIIVDECVHEDTVIVTDGGLERAAVVVERLQTGQVVMARVNDKYYRISGWSEKVEATVNVTTTTGIILRTSHNHPCAVLVNGRCDYRHACDLVPGDLLLAPRPEIATTTIIDSWYHLGLFIGDGHFLDNERVRFAVRKDVDDWHAVGVAMAVAWSGSFKSGFNRRGDFVFIIKSSALTAWLKQLGFKPGRKMGSIDPRFVVPSTDAAASLLRGLFDAKGSSYPSSVTCDSIDWALMNFAQKLMAYLGIGSSVFISNKRDRAQHAKLWRVAVSGENFRKWHRLVGFGFSRKQSKPVLSSVVDSERRIDPQPWLAHWREAGLPPVKLARILGTNTTGVSPGNRNKISLIRLVKWQKSIDNLIAVVPANYAAAKNLFGVSDAKVAAFAGIDSKTAWDRRQRGDDLWRGYVRNLQNRLASKRVDTSLCDYAVEIVKTVELADPARLIDLTVPGPACFEANGLLVHNCDKAVSDPWKNLFRFYFRGRRRYGFCLPGDVSVVTKDGCRKLSSFGDGQVVDVLCRSNGRDVFGVGTVVDSGFKRLWEVLFSDGTRLGASGDHLIADDLGRYIRVQDISPGQIIQTQDDRLVEKLISLTDFLGKSDPGVDLGHIAWPGLEFTRSYLDQALVGTEIDHVLASPLEFIADSGFLRGERNAVPVEELEKQEFIRRGVIQQPPMPVEVVSGLEFGREFESATAVSFSESAANFLSNGRVVDGVAAETLLEYLQSSLDLIGCLEDDGTAVTLHHSVLDSLDHALQFHRVVNAVSAEAGLPTPFLIVERLTAVQPLPSGLRGFLVLCDGKPVFHAVISQHLFFCGLHSPSSSLNDVWQFLDALRTQMPTKSPDLIGWAVHRALVYCRTVVASNGDDVVIPNAAFIPFSFDDHSLSSWKGVPVYLCRKAKTSVIEVVDTGKEVRMYDVLDVNPASNFYADGVLVHNSGTPFDPAKPVEAMVVQEHLGSVIFQETRENLTKLGRIIPCEYHMLACGLDGDINEASAYDIAYNEHITESVRFHTIVAKLCKRCKRDPMDGTLVLVDREALGFKLEEAVNLTGLRVKFIFGKTPQRKRDEALRAFERRELDVLIGGKIINRGLDLQGGCENLIIASGGKLQSEFIQKIGRALRRNRRGESKIYDFFFRCNRYLYDHSKARLKVIVQAGYPTKVVFPGGSVDGAELVKSRFKIRRKLLVPASKQPSPPVPATGGDAAT